MNHLLHNLNVFCSCPECGYSLNFTELPFWVASRKEPAPVFKSRCENCKTKWKTTIGVEEE